MPIFQGINSRTDKKKILEQLCTKKKGEQVYTGIQQIYVDMNKKRTTELYMSTVKMHNNNKFFRQKTTTYWTIELTYTIEEIRKIEARKRMLQKDK